MHETMKSLPMLLEIYHSPQQKEHQPIMEIRITKREHTSIREFIFKIQTDKPDSFNILKIWTELKQSQGLTENKKEEMMILFIE